MKSATGLPVAPSTTFPRIVPLLLRTMRTFSAGAVAARRAGANPPAVTVSIAGRPVERLAIRKAPAPSVATLPGSWPSAKSSTSAPATASPWASLTAPAIATPRVSVIGGQVVGPFAATCTEGTIVGA